MPIGAGRGGCEDKVREVGQEAHLMGRRVGVAGGIDICRRRIVGLCWRWGDGLARAARDL